MTGDSIHGGPHANLDFLPLYLFIAHLTLYLSHASTKTPECTSTSNNAETPTQTSNPATNTTKANHQATKPPSTPQAAAIHTHPRSHTHTASNTPHSAS